MTLAEKVIAVIRENSENLEDVNLNADLREDYGLDSFATLMIINGIEDAFSITLDEKDIPGIRTAGDIIEVLCTKYSIKEK